MLACCAPLVPEEPFLASYLRSFQVLGWLRTSCTYVLSFPTLAPVSPAPLFLALSSLSHTRPPRGHDLSCIRSLLPPVGDHRLHQLADLCTNLFGCVVGDSSLVESSKDLSLGVLVPGNRCLHPERVCAYIQHGCVDPQAPHPLPIHPSYRAYPDTSRTLRPYLYALVMHRFTQSATLHTYPLRY